MVVWFPSCSRWCFLELFAQSTEVHATLNCTLMSPSPSLEYRAASTCKKGRKKKRNFFSSLPLRSCWCSHRAVSMGSFVLGWLTQLGNCSGRPGTTWVTCCPRGPNREVTSQRSVAELGIQARTPFWQIIREMSIVLAVGPSSLLANTSLCDLAWGPLASLEWPVPAFWYPVSLDNMSSK